MNNLIFALKSSLMFYDIDYKPQNGLNLYLYPTQKILYFLIILIKIKLFSKLCVNLLRVFFNVSKNQIF